MPADDLYVNLLVKGSPAHLSGKIVSSSNHEQSFASVIPFVCDSLTPDSATATRRPLTLHRRLRPQDLYSEDRPDSGPLSCPFPFDPLPCSR